MLLLRLNLSRHLFFLVLLILSPKTWAVVEIIDSRIGQEANHTRVVLESDQVLRSSTIIMRNPDRMVLDLFDTDISKALEQLPSKLNAKSPLIKSIQISKNSDGKVRVEFFFRTESDPNIFNLKKDGQHGYRLVIDVYPSSRNISTLQLTPAPIVPKEKGKDNKSSSENIYDLPQDSPNQEERLLEVSINQLSTDDAAFVLVKNGRLMVKADDLKRWRIKLPNFPSVRYGDSEYYPLDTIRGMSYQVDEAALKVSLQANAGAFETTGIRGTAVGFAKPDPAIAGGFINYDFFTTHANGTSTSSGLFELGAFGQWGVATSTHLVRDSDAGINLVRLDTTITRDQPDRIASFRFGDVISNPGAWGGSARLGGLQYATNFNTQPGFIAFPLPGLSGEAVLPSTVDLYVNDALRLRQEVPMGPFSIQSLPIVTGPGEARLVIRDILGREQVITESFFTSNRLLQRGLHAFSYEVGALRENYSLESNGYGRLAMVGTHRAGLSDRFTGEMHGEVLQDQQTFGLGGTYLWAPTLISASIAGSKSERGNGGLLDLGVEFRSLRASWGINSRMMTDEFIHMGIPNNLQAARFINRAFASYAFPGYGNLSFNYTEQDYRDRQDLRLLGANYNFPIWNLGYLNLSVLHFLSEVSRTVFGMTFTKPLGDRTTASINSTYQPGFYENAAQIQRSLPVGSGFGYRALVGNGENSRRQLAVTAQNGIGTYMLEASQFRGEDAYRASISGGMALVDGDSFMSRKITDSFSIVEVPGHQNVTIYAENQPVGRTDNRGLSLLPNIRAYQKNKIRIEQSDIPLDSRVSQLETSTTPGFRSASKVKFSVEISKSATLQVKQDDGKPIPPGATARINDSAEEFPVGYDGRLYLSDVQERNEVYVEWPEAKCRFTFELITHEVSPDLGAFTCKSAPR